MPVHTESDALVPDIAAAIAAPARARMLYCLVDGRARTSTELALIAGVTPSTASIHLHRLMRQHLVKVIRQGKHHYYSLAGANAAAALEALSVLAGARRSSPAAPPAATPVRAARSCYDHIAGVLGVALYDRFDSAGWLAAQSKRDPEARDLTDAGAKAFAALGVDVDGTRALRRRFAFACLDWSERRPHLGGALGAAFLDLALKRRWVARQRDSRALTVTTTGQRELRARFGVRA